MKKMIALLTAITFVVSAAPLFAGGEKTYNPATYLHNELIEDGVEAGYFAKAPAQLFRGAHNVAFGWSEIITDLFQEPFVVGTALAPLTGPFTALMRTGSGIVDLCTFWIPGFKGWAV
jgi:putative exosortase-associated protein (TIGR04073 family)